MQIIAQNTSKYFSILTPLDPFVPDLIKKVDVVPPQPQEIPVEAVDVKAPSAVASR